MTSQPTLHIISGSSRVRAEIARLGFALGHHCEVYSSVSELAAHPPTQGVLLAHDAAHEGGVVALFDRLNQVGIWLPIIVVDEHPRPRRIVKAIKAGALDYLPLPLDPARFELCLERTAKEAESFLIAKRRMIEARNRISSLSNREREVLDWLSAGNSNKVIARQLDISPRTVEIHRANMMSKLGARHAAEAVRLKIEAKLEPEALP